MAHQVERGMRARVEKLVREPGPGLEGELVIVDDAVPAASPGRCWSPLPSAS